MRSCAVYDQWYVKRCNKCQLFGHYAKQCGNRACCGYCAADDHGSDLSHVQIKMYVKSFAAKTAKLLGTQQHTPILHIPKHVPCTLLKRIPSNHL